MSIFKFSEQDTRIFEYSKGERDEHGAFIPVYADPAAIDRQLDICLPNRNTLIDQFLSGVNLQKKKAQEVAVYEQNPGGYMAMLAEKNGYQKVLPNHEAGIGETVPNPESPLDYAKRMNVLPPTDFTNEEMATIRMSGVAHQNLCRGVRAAFGLPDFDEATGKGCTDTMAIAVLNHWQDWLEKKSGSTQETPTSSPPSPAT